MVNKGFPKFGMSQAGAFVAALKNYNLPDFILVLVAKECKSELLERGRIDDRLQSMNDDALELLHKVFVGCEEDAAGKYAQYRFFDVINHIIKSSCFFFIYWISSCFVICNCNVHSVIFYCNRNFVIFT